MLQLVFQGENLNLDKIDFDSSAKDSQFILSDTDKKISFYIKYPLQAFQDYSIEQIELHIMQSDRFNKEHDIYQVFDKELDERIGWIFPIQALISNEHDYSGNVHFLKYAHVTFHKLLINQFDYYSATVPTIDIDSSNSILIENFYPSDLIAFAIFKEKFADNVVNFEHYLPSLYLSGYYLPTNEIDEKQEISSVINDEKPQVKIKIRQISKFLVDETFLIELFKSSIKKEKHPLVKFHMLYQVIELLIDKIFRKDFKLLLESTKEENSNLFDIKAKLNEITGEKFRIKKLFDKSSIKENDYDLFKESCISLLKVHTTKKETIPDCLYSVRNLIFHSYRKLSESNINTVKQINGEFEKLIISLILDYAE